MISLLARARTEIASAIAVACCAMPIAAQATDVPGTGCADGTAIGAPIFTVDNAAPRIDSPDFGIEHLCEPRATAAFFILGNCVPTGPVPDWPLSSPCFGAWTNPPVTCGFGVDPALISLVDGGDVRTGKVIFSLPIPDSVGLIGLEQCVQFLCVDLASPSPCTGVSRGLSLVFEP